MSKQEAGDSTEKDAIFYLFLLKTSPFTAGRRSGKYTRRFSSDINEPVEIRHIRG